MAGWPTRTVPRQGRHPVRPGRRHRRHGANRRRGRLRRVIGFDMGGTSTDVSHYAGEFEREFDTEVAGRADAGADDEHPHRRGRRRLDPALSTAAASGSGPDSAGADPGPACYRRGGPLTVTDANVMLGRIQPGSLPARCSARAATSRWTPRWCGSSRALAREIAEATGDRAAREEVAAGSWPSPWRTWPTRSRRSRSSAATTSPGTRWPRFGGAGGQHACAVADALGMTGCSSTRLPGCCRPTAWAWPT